jgi:hypothetical protein
MRPGTQLPFTKENDLSAMPALFGTASMPHVFLQRKHALETFHG